MNGIMMRGLASLAILAASLLNVVYAGEPRELDLSLPKDFNDESYLQREQKLLIIRWNHPMEQKNAKEYGKRVIDRIDALFQENKRILDEDGQAVCSEATYDFLAIIKSDGELESFYIRRVDNKTTSNDMLIMNELERAVLSNSKQFEPFNSDFFNGHERVGIEGFKRAHCDMVRRYVPITMPTKRKR